MRLALLVLLLQGVVVVVAVASAVYDDSERFRERLLVRPLPDHSVLLHFEFNMTIDRPLSPEDEFYRLFPKPIAQLTIKHQVDEFHLSLSQGRWRYSQWGSPILPAPSGGQLIAYVRKNNSDPSRSTHHWKGLQQSLSGMVCASLEQIGASGHTGGDIPESVIRPESDPDYISRRSHTTFFGVLPREAVCTENLTPWAKLLPCRTQAGLGSLLSPLDLHDASYHSMGISVHQRSASSSRRQTVAKLWLSAVLDPLYLTKNRRWSLATLFKHVKQWPVKCSPISSTCEIHVDTQYVVRGGVVKELKLPKPLRTEENVMIFHPDTFQLDYDPGNRFPFLPVKSVPILVQRHATGKGLHVGGIVNTFVNTDSVPHEIAVFDSFPWYFRLQFHTMKLKLNGTELSSDVIDFRPAKESERPAVIEFQMEIPPYSTCSFSIQFEKAFLPMKDFPPDVSRGFDLAPAIVRLPKLGVNLYTESLVILFPYPDMSMPFNVIAFSSTFLAFFFGMMFNVIYRHPKELFNRKRGGLLLQAIRTLISATKRFFSRCKNGSNKAKTD